MGFGRALMAGPLCLHAASHPGRVQVGEAGTLGTGILLRAIHAAELQVPVGREHRQRRKQREAGCLLVLEGEEEGRRISTGPAGLSPPNPCHQPAPGPGAPCAPPLPRVP